MNLKHTRKTTTGIRNQSSSLDNERGVALILVLIILLLLTILGATVLDTSTSELRIAGNFRNEQNAFFSADGAVDFATTNALIYTSIIPGSTNSWPAGNGVVYDANGNITGQNTDTKHPNYNVVPIGTTGNTAEVRVQYVQTAALPAGSGSEVDAGLGTGSGFQANYFNVSVIGKGPNNSETEVESYVARVVPK